MKIAIMQPYFLPYIGYFQLINAVDKFVIYDDVNFINKGWINRNNILVNGKKHLFQIPLREASQNKLIKEIYIINDTKWKTNLLKTIEQAYKKSPHYKSVCEMIHAILLSDKTKIAELNVLSVQMICNYLKIETEIISSSERYHNKHLKGQERILDICEQEGADTYINPIGGTDLYDTLHFKNKKIELYFIESISKPYKHNANDFIPWLSIVDVMMNNSPDEISEQLNSYQLIKN